MKKKANRIKLIVEDSLTALEKLNESGNVYDLIFVDGNHSYEYAKKLAAQEIYQTKIPL